jgi:hypothetical protein
MARRAAAMPRRRAFLKLCLIHCLVIGALTLALSPAFAATLYISEFSSGVTLVGTTQSQILPQPCLTDQTVALSGVSAQSAAFNAKTHFVSLICDEGCSIAIGANPTASTSNFLLQHGVQVIFGVAPGQIVAAITNSAGN